MLKPLVRKKGWVHKFPDSAMHTSGLRPLIVHVEEDEEVRIISMRKADSDETDLYYKNAGYF
jgi:hypothetical protein